MLKKIVLIMLGLALGLSACGSPQSTQAAGSLTHVRLPMGYIPNVQFAPFYVAVEKGYFAQEGIEIEFDYSFETDGVALVGAGTLPFAVASGEQVLLARAQRLPVVYAFAWYQNFPVSVISAPDLKITKPADLKGQTIGLPGLFGASYIGLEALLFAGGLTTSDVKLEAIGFNQVAAFTAGQQKVVVVYTTNEPLELASKGFKMSELRVADYARLTANGIITNEKTIAENPKLVRGMARALSRGIADTIANPTAAYEICKKYVQNLSQADETVQKQVLATSIEFWKADRIGMSDPQAWSNMNDVLVKMGQLPAPLDVSKAFTNEFVP
jgi:NitT/TauT family transport system substrate-binding protein